MPTRLNRAEILRYLGLEPERFTVFLQGGGDGATDYWKAARPMLAAHKDMQIILSAGTYRGLLRRFRGVERLRVLPFTREIAPFMAASDVIMGKAGPNVLFEALALERPFIATTYFPGQEKGNLQFMQRHDIGRVALNFEQQNELLQALKDIQNPRDRLNPRSGEYRAWNCAANENVLKVVRSLIGQMKGVGLSCFCLDEYYFVSFIVTTTRSLRHLALLRRFEREHQWDHLPLLQVFEAHEAIVAFFHFWQAFPGAKLMFVKEIDPQSRREERLENLTEGMIPPISDGMLQLCLFLSIGAARIHP